jgi:hypothetical protein
MKVALLKTTFIPELSFRKLGEQKNVQHQICEIDTYSPPLKIF